MCDAGGLELSNPPHSPAAGSPPQRHITADIVCDVAFFESHAPMSKSPFFYVTSDTASAGRVVFETVTHMHPGARVVVTDSAANYSSPTSGAGTGPKDGFVHTLSTVRQGFTCTLQTRSENSSLVPFAFPTLDPNTAQFEQAYGAGPRLVQFYRLPCLCFNRCCRAFRPFKL